YGTIIHAATGNQTVQFTVPAITTCGSAIVLSFSVNSSLGAFNFQRTIPIGQSVSTFTENFDSVGAPAFPAGWTAVSVQNGINFITTDLNASSQPNMAYARDPSAVGGGTNLTSPTLPISSSAAVLTFQHRYDTEENWDGGVIEISINGGPFLDIIAAGGTFIENGYNGTLGANGVNNPLAGRSAWTGSSGFQLSFLTTSVRLPASAAGQNVQLRFRFGADDNTTGTGFTPGWNIDNVQVFGQTVCSFTPSSRARADFDGDGKTDLSIYRPGDNSWYVLKSNGGIDVVSWGLPGDRLVPGNYDGDTKADLAVFRPSDNRWYVLGSNGFTISVQEWGLSGDIPVAGDYDNDGRTDRAVFRPSENQWYILTAAGSIFVQQWGLAGDIPVPGDYDGDGKSDYAIYRNGQWNVLASGGGIRVLDWGLSGDRPVPADYDGDKMDDLAVFRPSDNRWYIIKSTNGSINIVEWGLTGDVPVPGDFDGDGSSEPAVYRNGFWYVLNSGGGISVNQWGLAGDMPIPAGYIP
ncbi:MAG: hypothetical protein ACRD6X_12415, partial [Pyrinomonadaceae bacterium]